MRFKYQPGDVFSYKDGIFIVDDIGDYLCGYQVSVIDKLDLPESRITIELSAKRGDSLVLNRGFVERQCQLMEGPKADAIRILYGDSQHK
jgi:hypothetical protein